MLLRIVKIGAPVLRTPCAPVPEKTRVNGEFLQFLDAMVKTMRKAEGVGLAANQVGLGIRAIVLESRADRRYPRAPKFPLQAYGNPRIVSGSRKKVLDWEGCLSIPGYRGLVPRHAEIVVEATTPEGRVVRRTVRGFEARVFQHEIDHINGNFYVDRMPDLRSWMHEDELMRQAAAAGALRAGGKKKARRR
jgi:peptide deformylase